MIRILIVDDQKSVREQLQILLGQEADLEVVGTAEDGYAAFEQVIELRPDIVLIDMIMPGIDGLSTAQIICQNFSDTKLIAWSNFDSEDLVNKFLQVGAKGYLLKDTPIEELVEAIALVNQGSIQISPRLTGNRAKNITDVVEFPPVSRIAKFTNRVKAKTKQVNVVNSWVEGVKNTFSLFKFKLRLSIRITAC
ncbi:MAG: response regulator transcription factor [Hydrococcus sp. SU_1_0]|nr:response regulator transcription factor [Hydrococcus sp. SU_1_0]